MDNTGRAEKSKFHVDQIRISAEILDRVFRWLSPFMAVLAVIIAFRATHFSGTWSSFTQITLLGVIVAAAFGHKRLRPAWRIYLYIASTAIIGIIGTLKWGLIGSGHAAVLLSMVFASTLGIRRFLIILCILMLAKVCVALAWIIGKPPIQFDLSIAYSPLAWGITIFGSVAAGTAAFIWEATYRRLSAATDQLQESKQRYKAIFNATNDALIIFDKSGRMMTANDATYELFEIDPAIELTYDVNDLSLGESPYSAVEAEEKMALALQGVPQIFEWQCRKSNGQIFWSEVALRATTIGGEARLIASVRDSSARKKAEEEMAKLESRLVQTQRIETVGRLAGGVAHDFNNMLSVILGHVELVLDQTRPEEKPYGSLLEIQNAARRSADLTRQLLAYARQQTISPKVLQINDTLSGMIGILQRLIGEMVDIIWVPGARLWPVKVDPSQIDQILSNLCVNARDAIDGMGKITIHAQNVTVEEADIAGEAGGEPGDYVMLSVQDNGCGMDRDTLSQIFEPFFTTKSVGEGTGLGLSTVYGIVRQNKGFIQVTSDLGVGSTIKVYLPRFQGKVEAEITPDPVPVSARHGQETILIVEDEPSILDLGKLILEKQGYRVLAAATPGEALQTAEQAEGDIDLLITDVVMPEMNGRDLAKRFVNLFPKIKRIFMSGYTAEIIAHHGVLDEATPFLQKPFTKKDLTDKVEAVLRAT